MDCARTPEFEIVIGEDGISMQCITVPTLVKMRLGIGNLTTCRKKDTEKDKRVSIRYGEGVPSAKRKLDFTNE